MSGTLLGRRDASKHHSSEYVGLPHKLKNSAHCLSHEMLLAMKCCSSTFTYSSHSYPFPVNGSNVDITISLLSQPGTKLDYSLLPVVTMTKKHLLKLLRAANMAASVSPPKHHAALEQRATWKSTWSPVVALVSDTTHMTNSRVHKQQTESTSTLMCSVHTFRGTCGPLHCLHQK